ncbi:unnamed protein product [Darwinula stevensoni]|uniref:Protein quiver n=1 Tax=Darwinula stevensoni TaxID=69355 RepID=A0A7R8X1X2_9CRUS|nr:unnamed protein product [Darwinula stevensoni]CAG0880551.1 unnamed protein product [Darwinula stevensoni]
MKALALLVVVLAFLLPSTSGLKCYDCSGSSCNREAIEQQVQNCESLTAPQGKRFFCGTGYSDNTKDKVVRRMCVPYTTGTDDRCFSTDIIPGANFSCLCQQDFCNSPVKDQCVCEGGASIAGVAFVLIASGIFAAIVAN